MIEVIDPETCTGCNICVNVCPMDVFAKTANVPVLARQDACQTCFQCEARCPEDALYVHPVAVAALGMSLDQAKATGMMGSYRRAIGWADGSKAARATDASYLILGKG